MSAAGRASSVFPDQHPRHGGDLDFATAHYGLPAGGWIDLSTGINPQPWPIPEGLVAPDLGKRLPSPGALAGLIAVARDAYGVTPGVDGVAGPGSDALLRLLPLVLPTGNVAIVGPTYSGHSEAWRSAGREVRELSEPDEVVGARFAVLCNPNNPDGRRWPSGEVAALARRTGERGGVLIVDEAFADTDPRLSLAHALAGLPAVVLRSLGKFYGLAGLRVGFAFGEAATVGRLREVLGAWPLSGAAIAIASAALSDVGWRTATRQRLAAARERLDAMLAATGLAVAGGTGLFALVADDAATAAHRVLAAEGIWTRAFPAFPRWLRIGLPPEEGWPRLEAALRSVRRQLA